MKSYITDALITLGFTGILLFGGLFLSAGSLGSVAAWQLFHKKAVPLKEAVSSSECCQITHEEQLELELGIERAERRQDEVNRFYQDNVLTPAAKICAAHGWDCPDKIVFDPRSISFNPKPDTPKPPKKK
jgi:hypothetical protein